MPWTVNHKFPVEIKADQGVFPRKGTVYPWLPAIIDEETLIEITTLESGEHAFVAHINLIGNFHLDFDRKPPFQLRQVNQ